MRKIRFGAVGLTVCLTVASMSAVFAEDSKNYVGASVGQSSFNNSNLAYINPTNKNDKGLGFKMYIGFPLTESLSLEVGYMDLGHQSASSATTSAEANVNVFNMVGVASFPITERIALFGKLGGYRWDVDSRIGSENGGDIGFNVTYGLGVKYSVNKDVDVRVEWEQFRKLGYDLTTGQSNVNLLSIGAVYNFKFF